MKTTKLAMALAVAGVLLTAQVVPADIVAQDEYAGWSFCPIFPTMIWHCEGLDEIITEGGRAARTA